MTKRVTEVTKRVTLKESLTLRGGNIRYQVMIKNEARGIVGSKVRWNESRCDS